MRNIIKFAALVVVAAIGAFVLRALYIASSRPGPAPTAPTVHIRAAAADLPDGLLLRESDLVWKAVPRGQVPAGALVQVQAQAQAQETGTSEVDLKGDLLRHAVKAGTPLGQADVISPNAPGFLAAALKPGMRAISVAIDDVSGNAGLIQPGDYVDVLLTQQMRTATGAQPDAQRAVETEAIVERVRVLAVGSAFRRPNDAAAAPNTRARTVTFELTPRSAEVVTVAAHLGSLSLALRSFATRDRHTPDAEAITDLHTPPVWAGDVSRALHTASPQASATRTALSRPVESPRAVLVYRGSRQSDAGGSAMPGLPTGLPPLPSGAPPATQPVTQPAAHPAA
ncbi:Flp pilus assembly protein CpaB [Trinickia sp. LjRoot230]|uniref:Flp pilus assembly protein CpaB n=1 Tax=Trinickia sp. LjRoot230 TaxID=3342288 RepID=UPI003ECCF5D4